MGQQIDMPVVFYVTRRLTVPDFPPKSGTKSGTKSGALLLSHYRELRYAAGLAGLPSAF